MDDDSFAFWDEQERPTRGAGGKPRVEPPLPLPDPLPSLSAPPKEELEGAEQGGPGDEVNFDRAYGGKEMISILDTDGRRIEVPDMTTFEEAAERLRFKPFLRAGLAKRGFHQLTPVQQCAMPLLLSGRDFLASAFTGSGKTAAYLLPILTSLDQLSRLVPGLMVAAHYKAKAGARSAKPAIGRVRGIRQGMAAIEFEQATGLSHRQLVPPDWVVGVPDSLSSGSWTAL